jgi:hypothetical protein
MSRQRAIAFGGLLILLMCGAPPASAQDAATAATPPTPPPVVDPASLERIAAALASTPSLDATAAPRFYASTVATPPAFKDYMKGWNLSLTHIVAPEEAGFGGGGGGLGGIEVLSLIHAAIQAYRGHEARLIRERIDRELRAVNGQ